MKVILYTRPDGGVSIVHPAYNDPIGGQKENESEQEYMDRIITGSVPSDAVDVNIVEDTEIIEDRVFRNAWVQESKKLKVDMPKALSLAQDKIRITRGVKFVELDAAIMVTLETDDTSARDAIVVKKQTLRDSPRDIRLISAPNEVRLKIAMENVISDIEIL